MNLSSITRRGRQWMTHKRMAISLTRAYGRFARCYPQWAASLFDDYFLRRHIAPLLRAELAHKPLNAILTADVLARLWASQLHYGAALKERVVAELTPAAADFLCWLEQELKNPLGSRMKRTMQASVSCAESG